MALLKRLRHKLAASSLIEVVVAMLITAICFSLAFATLGQLTVHSLSNKQLKADRLLQNWMQESLAREDYLSEKRPEGAWKLLKSVEPYAPQLLEISIRALDGQGKLISEKRRLVYVQE